MNLRRGLALSAVVFAVSLLSCARPFSKDIDGIWNVYDGDKASGHEAPARLEVKQGKVSTFELTLGVGGCNVNFTSNTAVPIRGHDFYVSHHQNVNTYTYRLGEIPGVTKVPEGYDTAASVEAKGTFDTLRTAHGEIAVTIQSGHCQGVGQRKWVAKRADWAKDEQELLDQFETVVRNHDEASALRLIATGIDVNLWTPSHHAILLYVAANEGSIPVVQSLIRAGANVNDARSGMLPLCAAAIGGHLEVVRALLQAGADPQKAGLACAAQSGRIDILETMIASGADLKDSPRALYTASGACQPEMVRYLVAHGFKPNDPGMFVGGITPIAATIFETGFVGRHRELCLDTARALLKAGANPRLKTILAPSAYENARYKRDAAMLALFR